MANKQTTGIVPGSKIRFTANTRLSLTTAAKKLAATLKSRKSLLKAARAPEETLEGLGVSVEGAVSRAPLSSMLVGIARKGGKEDTSPVALFCWVLILLVVLLVAAVAILASDQD